MFPSFQTSGQVLETKVPPAMHQSRCVRMNLRGYTEGGETARRQCFFCASSRASFSRFTLTLPKRGDGYFSSPPSTRAICTSHPCRQNANIVPHYRGENKEKFGEICKRGLSGCRRAEEHKWLDKSCNHGAEKSHGEEGRLEEECCADEQRRAEAPPVKVVRARAVYLEAMEGCRTWRRGSTP